MLKIEYDKNIEKKMQTHIKKNGQDTQFVECVRFGTITQEQAPYKFVL